MLVAPLMEEPTTKSTTTGNDSYRSVPTPFLTKTYQLVDDESIDHVISWNDDGSTFIVWNTMAFAKDFLPKYFKHNNFTSFLRQLNTYVVSDRWEFANECFRKGKKQLLCEIQRRKLAGPVPSTASNAAVVTTVGASAIPSVQLLPLTGNSSGEEQVISSDETPTRALAELIDENDRLRREKVQLTEQLVEVKSLCNNIFSLMSSFVESQFKSSFKVRESVLASAKSLDLFPVKRPAGEEERAEVKEEETNQIGVKRAREYREGATETAENDTTLRLQPPDRWVVKSERINCQK
ncbi:heat stress transcription factor B-2b-like [Cucumis melo var. makuwa]|uniref:Heat stress transcription factor B-2b-like n=1 Tax=Cucumis melo var. makuwa TaxID=1194695 RepID=A0A5D3DH79_CUCMM|nr:heat stress transcription factor B-2b-like [Cucumis melo var. makuwa]